MKNTYSEPKLFPTDRNIKKSWFVAFRFTDPNTGDRKQFQFRGDINHHKSKHDRIIEGTSLCSALLVMLKEGWNPFTDETEKEYDRKTLHDLLDDMLLIKKSTFKSEVLLHLFGCKKYSSKVDDKKENEKLSTSCFYA